MFEDRTISVLTYNKETLLAEKMQTIINRGIANTRLRDFYDVYSIMNFYGEQIEPLILYDAFSATCEKRKTIFSKDDIEATLHLISDDLHMAELLGQFQKSNFYVGDLEWKNKIAEINTSLSNDDIEKLYKIFRDLLLIEPIWNRRMQTFTDLYNTNIHEKIAMIKKEKLPEKVIERSGES